MKHFTKTELIRCFNEDKAQRCKGCQLKQAASGLPYGIEESIIALGEDVLDPAREKLGMPVVVNSGFRCPLHNAKMGGVGGAAKPGSGRVSQHVVGQAVDVHCADNRRLAKIIVANGKWDQLILYPTFIHVSYKRQGGNRKQILRKTATGYQAISAAEIKKKNI